MRKFLAGHVGITALAGAFTRQMQQRARALALFGVTALGTLAGASGASADGPANTIFGYETAGANARLLEYHVNQSTEAVTFRQSCVPEPGPYNGRGVAYSKRTFGDQAKGRPGSLYLSKLTFPFVGDGLIHITGLPPACPHVKDIPFGDGPGGVIQDSIGAMDFDRGNGDLYVAGYRPTAQTGGPDLPLVGTHQILYRVDSNSGDVRGWCSHPRQGTGGGNDSLTVANLAVGPGQPPPAPPGGGEHKGKVLLTDFGEFRPDSGAGLTFAIDPSSLDTAPPTPAEPCRVVAVFNAGTNVNRYITGIEAEMMPQPGGRPQNEVLVGTNLDQFYDFGNQPYATGRLIGSADPMAEPEDISVERLPAEGLN